MKKHLKHYLEEDNKIQQNAKCLQEAKTILQRKEGREGERKLEDLHYLMSRLTMRLIGQRGIRIAQSLETQAYLYVQ